MVVGISAAHHAIFLGVELGFLDVLRRCPCCRTVGGTLLVFLANHVANAASN